MKRLAIYAALVVAAVVPATTGLLANASFSQNVPVRTPAQAQVLDDDAPTTTRTTSPTTPSTSPTSVDDHGGDRDRTSSRTSEPGDDHGGDRDRTSSRTSEPGDDHGGEGSSGHGSDD